MKFDDLREFIDCMRTRGDLQEINGVDWDLEIGAITETRGGISCQEKSP